MKLIQTVRTHPKKIIFFSTVLGFGGRWLYRNNEDKVLRKRLCQQILPLGRQPFRVDFSLSASTSDAGTSPGRVTVLMNGKAGKSKANGSYKDNCEPLLHLTGSAVSLIQSESLDQLKTLCAVLDHNDADSVLIAGGDGTLHQAVNAILARTDEQRKAGRSVPLTLAPFGVHSHAFQRLQDTNLQSLQVPNGKSGSLTYNERQKSIFNCFSTVQACVSRRSKKLDLLQVQELGEASEQDTKEKQSNVLPTFGVATVKFGRFVTAESNADRFWLTGPLRYGCSLVKERLRGSPINTQTVRLRIVHRCKPGCESCKRAQLELSKPTVISTVNSSSSNTQSKSYFSRFFSTGAKLGAAPVAKTSAEFTGFLDCPDKQETVVDAVRIDDLIVRFVGDSLSVTLGEATNNFFKFVLNGLRSRKWQFDQSVFRTFDNINELQVEFVELDAPARESNNREASQTEVQQEQEQEQKQKDKLTLFVDGEKYEFAQRTLRIRLMRSMIDVCTASS